MAKQPPRYAPRGTPPRSPGKPPPTRPLRQRPTAAARGYGSRWQKYRMHYLAKHPLCVICERTGRVTPAEHVDHIKPAVPGTPAFWDGDNHQALCRICHSRKTVQRDGGFGRPKK